MKTDPHAKGITHDGRAPLDDTSGVVQIVGGLDAGKLRVAMVASRYNGELTRDLVSDALEVLRARGAGPEDLLVVWVPGAFEIPSIIERLATSEAYDALIALGAVVEGETPHAELITQSVTSALSAIARNYGIPVIDTVVAARTYAQAEARCRSGKDSRGRYAAYSAIEMAHVFSQLPEPAELF